MTSSNFFLRPMQFLMLVPKKMPKVLFNGRVHNGMIYNVFQKFFFSSYSERAYSIQWRTMKKKFFLLHLSVIWVPKVEISKKYFFEKKKFLTYFLAFLEVFQQLLMRSAPKKNLVEFLPNLSKILKNLFLLHVAAKIYLLNFGTSELTRNRIEITRKNSLTILQNVFFYLSSKKNYKTKKTKIVIFCFFCTFLISFPNKIFPFKQ